MSDIALGVGETKSTDSVRPVDNSPSPAVTQTADEAENPAPDSFTPKEKYEYLSEYGTQILAMLSVEDGCTYLSKNFESITGNESDACMGTGFYDIMQKDYHERLNELLAMAIAENKPQQLHCKLAHNGGQSQWYLFTIHPAKKKDGGSCVCILENIHENVQAQATLQKAKMEAELALSARSEFLANMSHDLRTPLNAVIGFAQIIESQMFGQVNPQYLDYAKHIQESGYDLLAKIEDLLEIASIDSGRVRVEKVDANLNELLKHAIATQAHHATTAEVLVEYAPPPRGDILLHVDRVKMQHIIGHLLANAVKFSHRGGKITIEAEIDDDNQFVLRVCDHGIGINKTKLAEIIDALQESNCWSIGNNGNIGLGLALTREFVALHGGEISIQSAIGDGTTVEIRLPEDCIRPVSPSAKMPFYAQVAG